MEYGSLAKGIKQILMERDLWKPEMRLNAPIVEGQKVEGLSAKHVLSSCPDFANEKTHLQEFIEKRGPHFTMRKTPICHPEIAGIGIEYAWGDAKRFYRQIPERLQSVRLANKNQMLHVKQSLRSVTKNKSRKYAGKTFEYKLTYAAVPLRAMTHSEIETNVKKMKQHRDCGRLNAAFIKEVTMSLSGSEREHLCSCQLCVSTNIQ